MDVLLLYMLCIFDIYIFSDIWIFFTYVNFYQKKITTTMRIERSNGISLLCESESTRMGRGQADQSPMAWMATGRQLALTRPSFQMVKLSASERR